MPSEIWVKDNWRNQSLNETVLLGEKRLEIDLEVFVETCNRNLKITMTEIRMKVYLSVCMCMHASVCKA